MKYIYMIAYEDSISLPEIGMQRRQLNNFFIENGIEKVICGYDSFSFHLLDEAIHHYHTLVSVISEFHCDHDLETNRTIPLSFEKELLLPNTPVVFILKKLHAKHLLTYINPFFSEFDEVASHELGLFRIVCESDHIGIERIWIPFLKPTTD
ncbi:hypothetical protein [Ectobacillus polymachus]|uniref:hypothetical protein n=1 Tax=Ectobacillus polymachus TaxID=1508806 RepID=UPI003A8C2F9A